MPSDSRTQWLSMFVVYRSSEDVLGRRRLVGQAPLLCPSSLVFALSLPITGANGASIDKKKVLNNACQTS